MLARAKVNLYLHVLGRRDDGYHLLDSLVVFADLCDEVTASASNDLALEIDGPFAAGLAADRSNLVLRAARSLRESLGLREGAALRLTKNLPIASGIGGGSADAAAALLVLAELWHVDPAPALLARIALSLGADVPVCLAGRASFVGGIGEEIQPVGRLPQAWLLLVNPGVAISTQAVFGARSGAFSTPARWADPPQDFAGLLAYLEGTRNDLTEGATMLTSAITHVLEKVRALRNCALARLSGSGATCFGLFETEQAAKDAEAELRRHHPNWWARATALASHFPSPSGRERRFPSLSGRA